MAPVRRSTRQREAIRLAFLNTPHPMSPRQVLQAARPYSAGIGIATVYRNLKLLCEDGWLVQLELPGDPTTYYERAQRHHHHFVCRVCQGLFRVDGCPSNLSELTPSGCVLEDHELVLYGVCSACRSQRPPGRAGMPG